MEWESQVMEDGELWYHATLTDVPDDSLVANGSVITVTAEGKSLLAKKGLTTKKLLVFMRASVGHEQKPHVRRFIAGQGNGTVYALGTSGLAIKETAGTQSIHSAVERMDSLYRILENATRNGYLPAWIGLPKHYGYLTPPAGAKNNRQYLLMEKIQDGVTVEDILSFDERGEEERNQVNQRLGHTLTPTTSRRLGINGNIYKGL